MLSHSQPFGNGRLQNYNPYTWTLPYRAYTIIYTLTQHSVVIKRCGFAPRNTFATRSCTYMSDEMLYDDQIALDRSTRTDLSKAVLLVGNPNPIKNPIDLFRF